VGHLLVVDPDHIETSNLPRLVGARPCDAMPWLTKPTRPAWMQRLGRRLALPKVNLAERLIRHANPSGRMEVIRGDFLEAGIAALFTDCDYLFLASDTIQE